MAECPLSLAPTGLVDIQAHGARVRGRREREREKEGERGEERGYEPDRGTEAERDTHVLGRARWAKRNRGDTETQKVINRKEKTQGWGKGRKKERDTLKERGKEGGRETKGGKEGGGKEIRKNKD